MMRYARFSPNMSETSGIIEEIFSESESLCLKNMPRDFVKYCVPCSYTVKVGDTWNGKYFQSLEPIIGLIGDSITVQNSVYLGANLPLTSTGGVTTVTTSSAHTRAVSEIITLYQSTVPVYNGLHTITSIPTPTTFTFDTPNGAGTTPATAKGSSVEGRQSGYFTWANSELRQAFSVLPNCGRSGDSSTQMLEHIQELITLKPSSVIMLIGINDILGDQTSQFIFSNVQQAISLLFDSGVNRVFLCTTIPVADSYPFTVSRLQQQLEYNNLIRGYNDKRVTIVDLFDVIVDKQAGTNKSLPNTLYDGLHPSTYGAFLMGKKLSQKLSSVYVKRNIPLPTSSDDVYSNTGNLTDNPLMINSGGTMYSGVTGIAPKEWVIDLSPSSTAICSLEQRTYAIEGDTYGKSCVVRWWPTADGQYVRISNSSIMSRLSSGEYDVIGDVLVTLRGAATVKELRVIATMTSGGVSQHVYPILSSYNKAHPQGDGTVMPLAFRAKWHVLPGTYTNGQLQFTITSASAGGIIEVRFGRVSIKKI